MEDNRTAHNIVIFILLLFLVRAIHAYVSVDLVHQCCLHRYLPQNSKAVFTNQSGDKDIQRVTLQE